jgi:hypothetical protein
MRSTTLPEGWHKALLIVHVAASVGGLGAGLALLALGAAGLRGTDPAFVYPAAHMVAAGVLAPLALAALGTGLALGLLTRWGLFRHGWVTAKLLITAGMSGALLLSLLPLLQRQASAAVETAPHVLAIGGRVTLVVATGTASVLFAIALVLAILKPDWRRQS